MRQAIEHLTSRSQRDLAHHPLYNWIRNAYDDHPERKLEASLPILGFILTFPYYNNQYLGCDINRFCDEQKSIAVKINEHVKEDSRHLDLFIRDVEHFSLDKQWGLTDISDWLWVIWSSPALVDTRKILHQRVRTLLASGDNLYLRYLHIEQIEQDGHYLFSAFTDASKKIIEKDSENDLIYFGQHHLDREDGHVDLGDTHESTNFDAQTLQHARLLIDEKHQLSMDMNDLMVSFVNTSAAYQNPGLFFKEEKSALMRSIDTKLDLYERSIIPPIGWSICPSPSRGDSDLFEAWNIQHQRFLNHPLFDRMVNAKEDELEHVLRIVMIYFANRLLNMNAFHLYDLDLDHKEIKSPEEKAFEAIRLMFSTHYGVFFHDWMQLDIDAHIEQTPADFLRIMFADKDASADMVALHEFRRQAIQVATTPLRKFWCYLSMYCMALAYTKATKILAERYYQRTGKRLAYMSGILQLCYPDVDSDWNNPQRVELLYNLTANESEKQIIIQMLNNFCDLGVKQWDLVSELLK